MKTLHITIMMNKRLGIIKERKVGRRSSTCNMQAGISLITVYFLRLESTELFCEV